MEADEVQVPVDRLKLGMYVSRLDRPWLDSPFWFQGFSLDTQDTITSVQDECEYVYIDRNKCLSDPEIDRVLNELANSEPIVKKDATDNVVSIASADAKSDRKDSRSQLNTMKLELEPEDDHEAAAGSTNYVDETDIEDEWHHAKEVLHELSQVIESTFEKLRNGERIEPDQITGSVRQVVNSISRNPDALIWLARLGKADQYTFRHCINTSIWALALGRQLGLPKSDLELLGRGALYCDLGKSKIPEELLTKPDKLQPFETEIVQQHVNYSLEILEELGEDDPTISLLVAQHHENHDGSGYPYRLEEDEIDLYARIASIADTFDAIISERPYQDPKPISQAIQEMYQLRGKRFQPELMEEFIHAIGLYPAGSLVELSNGSVGAVVGESRVRRLRPRIMLLLDADKHEMDHFPIVDLLNEELNDDGQLLHIVRDLAPGSYGLDPSKYFLS